MKPEEQDAEDVVKEVRANGKVRVGEWTMWEPDAKRKDVVVVRSKRNKRQYVKLETMQGVRLALRLLAMAERKR